MSSLDSGWAVAELDKFIDLTKMRNASSSGGGVTFLSSQHRTSAPDDEVSQQAPVVERILDRVIPDWRASVPDSAFNNRWSRHREACIRARELLLRDREISAKLGEDAPALSASQLHTWAWEGARPLWQSGHFRSAVEDALKKVNAETQNKLGRRDVSEARLFQEAFSIDPPKLGRPRLHRMDDDQSDTFKSMQRGARALAEGIYAGIRNPLGHEEGQDIDQQIALEYLAAISVLARWVDEADVAAVSNNS